MTTAPRRGSENRVYGRLTTLERNRVAQSFLGAMAGLV